MNKLLSSINTNRGRVLFALFLLFTLATACNSQETQPEELKIGLIAPITGSIPAVGQSTVNAAELAVSEINEAGGLQVGDVQYTVTLVIEDNEDRAEAAVTAAQKLINQENVIAIIGPQASRNAIPAATVAENSRIPMISPWSTNPDTTAGKEYVFRTAFIDPFQGRVLARFTIEDLDINKAAILFDEASAYNRDIAAIYREVFEETGGEVVAYETYTTGETDFTQQLANIKDAGADILFLPNYYEEVLLQAQQVRDLDLEIPILGGDSWGTMPVADRSALDGSYFSTHYSTDIASENAQAFIEKYEEAYGELPDDVAALTYDAFGMVFAAINSQDDADPESIREGLSALGRYEGVTGEIEYKGSGDPVKSAVILQIVGDEFKFFKLANP